MHRGADVTPPWNTLDVPAKVVDSIRDSELDSNEIDESNLQFKKHDEQRISILK
jgi:hypothetical protein